MSVDRKSINILLAALDIEQRELAHRMGYDKVYVSNVLCGFTPASDAFKQSFGEVVADLVIGTSRTEASRLPAGPLVEFLENRAKSATCRSAFYEELGLNVQGWINRKYVTESLLDRICCQLGVHPSAIYGDSVFERLAPLAALDGKNQGPESS